MCTDFDPHAISPLNLRASGPIVSIQARCDNFAADQVATDSISLIPQLMVSQVRSKVILLTIYGPSGKYVASDINKQTITIVMAYFT